MFLLAPAWGLNHAPELWLMRGRLQGRGGKTGGIEGEAFLVAKSFANRTDHFE